jgi:SAM-dependent methyltransferase
MSALTTSRLKKIEDRTTAYYDRHAQAYFNATRSVNMSALYEQFLPYVPPGGRILDAGSGSGRDTFAFVQMGYDVDAFDASASLAELSSRLTGVKTQVVRFQEFESGPVYDGIWACASLLHVSPQELEGALGKLVRAMKPDAALYVSVKHGNGQRTASDGRLFVDLNRAQLGSLFARFRDLTLSKVWVSGGEGLLQGKDEWLNAIALKDRFRGPR